MKIEDVIELLTEDPAAIKDIVSLATNTVDEFGYEIEEITNLVVKGITNLTAKLYFGYIEAGFTEEVALYLVMNFGKNLNNSVKQTTGDKQ